MSFVVDSSYFKPWELSEEDCTDGAVCFDSCFTCHVENDAAPDCVRALHGVVMRLCITNGNGKCGIHAIFGTPVGREIKVANERDLVLKLFGRSYADLLSQVISKNPLRVETHVQLLQNVFSKIWPSFIQPKYEQEFKDAQYEPFAERSLYERELEKDVCFCQDLRDFYLHKTNAEANEARRKEVFLDRIKAYFGNVQHHLPFWYNVAVHRNLMPSNCLEVLMSLDMEVQRNFALEHQQIYYYLREEDAFAEHSCKFMGLFNCEGVEYVLLFIFFRFSNNDFSFLFFLIRFYGGPTVT